VSPVEHLVTSGTFSLDGGTWDVDNNVWIVGDDREVVVIDADPIAAAAVGDRRVSAVVCTHAHGRHMTISCWGSQSEETTVMGRS